jgi:hypothetical protein
MTALGRAGIERLFKLQRDALQRAAGTDAKP